MGGGAWPFLVGGVISLVNSDNPRDSCLLNRSGLPFGSPGKQLARQLLLKANENEQQQVCDALRCSGLHACYNGRYSRLITPRGCDQDPSQVPNCFLLNPSLLGIVLCNCGT